MDAAAAATLGLHVTDMHCLEVLARRGPLSAGEVAAATGLSRGAATALLDRMERARFATRTSEPHDRRRVLVAPTALAARRSSEIFGPLVEDSQKLLVSYSVSELKLIDDFLRSFRRVLARHTARLQRRPRRAARDSRNAAAPASEALRVHGRSGDASGRHVAGGSSR